MSSEVPCKAILKESGKKIVGGSDMDTLRDAQKAYAIANDGITTYSRQNAYSDWVKYQQTLVDGVASGRIHDTYTRSHAEFELDYKTKTDAFRSAMLQISQSVLPLALKICGKFCLIANEMAANALAADLAEHSKFGIIHRPSGLVAAFGKAADWATARCPNTTATYYAPKILLPYLDL